MAFPPSDHEADIDKANPVADDGSTHGSSKPKVELTPEQELSLSSFYLFCDAILIIYFRGTQTNLALANLFVFQTQCCLSVL
jgi:hypothetical protein